jgi:hypothetical protein
MVPSQQINLTTLEIIEYPSLTYKIDLFSKRIVGKIDGFEAIIQAVTKNLFTERYAYVIYSDVYGVELERFIGKDFDFIKSDLKRAVSEALLMDDRITSITDFKIEKVGLNNVKIDFKVMTVNGVLQITSEVNV